MFKILVIWELVPEETRFYMFEASKEQREMFLQANGFFVGQVFKEYEAHFVRAASWVHDLIERSPEQEIKLPQELLGPYTVICSGVML